MGGFRDKMKGTYYYEQNEDEKSPKGSMSWLEESKNEDANNSEKTTLTEPAPTTKGVSLADPDVNPWNDKKKFNEGWGEFASSIPEETEEQRKKRERRDAIRMGYAGFLDGLNALSNLYYTTKGAPNQQYVGGAFAPVMADIKEKEKLRQSNALAREKEKQDWLNRKNKAQMDWLRKGIEWDVEQKEAEKKHQRELEKIEAREDMYLAREGVKFGNKMAYGQQQNEAAMERTKVREANINQREENRGNRGGSSTSSKRSITLSDGKSYDYSKVREGALESVFNKMKDMITDTSEKLKVADLKTTQQKLSWLNENAHKYPELDGEIREALGIEKSKKKSLLPGKSNDNNNKKGQSPAK